MFEEQLKLAYIAFIQILEASTKDALEFVRDAAIKGIYSLLLKHPEQEKTLLTLLTNKLVFI